MRTVEEEERLVLDVLEEVGAAKRAASRAMPPGTPGRAAEPRWTMVYLHAELRRRQKRVSLNAVRRALYNLAAAGKVERHARASQVLWSLPARWDGWSG